MVKPTYLYGLVDIITKIPDDKLSKITFSWYNEDNTKLYYLKKLPYACKKCRDNIIKLLSDFCRADLAERKKIKHLLLFSLNCDCVQKYYKELELKSSQIIEQRIDTCVKKIKQEKNYDRI